MQPGNCKNCGAALSDQYCAHCGQQVGRENLNLRQALGEIFGDLFDWDSRLWRTLFSLTFRPGFLTAEFIAGRRARYVPPFRLYLIISFIVFLTLSIGARLDKLEVMGDHTGDASAVVVIDAEQEEGEADEDATVNIGLADENSPAWLQNLEKRIESNALNLREDSNEFLAEMLEYLPQMMFLMLPLFALLMRVLYLGCGFHYLHHLVFGLHFHSFIYLLHLFNTAITYTTGALAGSLFLLFAVIYLPVSLCQAFDSSIKGAITKSIMLALSYGLLLALGFAGVSLLTLVFM